MANFLFVQVVKLTGLNVTKHGKEKAQRTRKMQCKARFLKRCTLQFRIFYCSLEF